MIERKFSISRYCISCARYKPPGGPAGKPWKCADCRKAIAERKAKLKPQELGR